MPTLPERLRQAAQYTGLDAMRDLLIEAAGALENRPLVDGNQIAELVLRDPAGGEMRVSSDLRTEQDGAMRFTVTNQKTGRRFGVYIGLAELTPEIDIED